MAPIDFRQTHPLADFLDNHREHLQRLRESDGPEVLTVDGSPEWVLQSAEGYQGLLDRLEYAEGVAGLRKAYAQIQAGETQVFTVGLDAIRARHGL